MSGVDIYTYENLTVSSSFASSSKSNTLVYKLPYPISLKNSDICLSSLSIPYSFPNISSKYGLAYLSYQIGATIYNVTYPDNSLMTISDISAYLQLKMKANGHYLFDNNQQEWYPIQLDPNTTYYRVTLTIKPIPSSLASGWTNPASLSLTGYCPVVTFPVDSTNLNTILGFDGALSYPSTSTNTSIYMVNGQKVPQITPVTAINVTCNLANASQFNFIPQSIYTFSPNTSFGSLIDIKPSVLLWYKAIDFPFNEIRVSLLDQSSQDLQVLDSNIIVNLYIRSKNK